MPSAEQLKVQLDALRDIGAQFTRAQGFRALCKALVPLVSRALSAERSTLFLCDNGELWSFMAEAAELEIRLQVGEGIAGWVAQHGAPALVMDAYADPRFSPATDELTGYTTRDAVAVPITTPQGDFLGVLQALNSRAGFSDDDLGLLAAIAGHTAYALQNAHQSDRLIQHNRHLQLVWRLERRRYDSHDAAQIIHLFGQDVRAELGAAGVEVRLDDGTVARAGEPSEGDADMEAVFSAGDESGQLRAWGMPAPWEGDLGLGQILGGQLARVLELAKERRARIKHERLAMLGHLLAAVAHDIRNPMSVVSGFAALLVEDETRAERERHAVVLEQQLGEMNAMVSDLLAYARGEAASGFSIVSLSDIVSPILPWLRRGCQERDVELRIEQGEGSVFGDPGRMKRILQNLAKNAMEVMPRGGVLSIAVDAKGRGLALEVGDTGPGIPGDVAHSLFDPFVTANKEGGMGLGLAIVKRFVDDHHGSITMSPRQPQGTVFRVLLPGS